ncbi:MAG: Hsp20/alpha crystallin family protein [Acidobacteria bacterium]|nr:Hsp20/alpha crystallin family protein [Acidobacteriota bacterium]
MAMVRFDPFRDLAVLQDRMNRLFNDSYSPRREDDLMNRGSWTPAVDIYEIEGALVLKAELPDMRRDDIDISVENGTLTIRGERKLDGELKQENFHRVERAYGSFERSFSLPNTVDAVRIGAEYKDGVLTVTLPVREEAKPRTIKIEVAAA